MRVQAMISQEALFHCTCTQPFSHTRPPPAEAPLAQYEHHNLSELLFCEDCDAIRCNQCAACEVACYYCPNCLFEVPSASVRGEKNRSGPILLAQETTLEALTRSKPHQMRTKLLPVPSMRSLSFSRRFRSKPVHSAVFGSLERRRTAIPIIVQRLRVGFATDRYDVREADRSRL